MIPLEIAALLAGTPTPGSKEQAFPLLTVDESSYPHVALVSRAELRTDDAVLSVAVTGDGVRANLRRTGRATLVVVGDDSAHSLELRAIRSIERDGILAVAFELVSHRADSVGIRLDPIRFVATHALGVLERWTAVASVLDAVETVVAD